MKNLFFIAAVIISFLCSNVSAQIIDFPEMTPGTPAGQTASKLLTIENLLKVNLVVIQQNYQLCDVATKQYYGRDGKDIFGSVYTFGVKTPKGFYTSGRFLYPWIYDSNYEKYKENFQYEPVVSTANYRDWSGVQYKKIKYSAKHTSVADSIVYVKKRIDKSKGLAEVSVEGKGYIAWVVQGKDKNVPDSFAVKIVESTPKYEAGNNFAQISEVAPAGAIGGIFVVEQITESNLIAYCLAGILTKVGEKWFVKKNLNASKTVIVNPDGLTPAKRAK